MSDKERNPEEKRELRLYTTIPFLRKIALMRGDKVALILLEAQERLIRAREDDAGSLIAGLATARLEDEEGWKEACQLLDDFFLLRMSFVENRLQGRLPPGMTPEEFLRANRERIAERMRTL